MELEIYVDASARDDDICFYGYVIQSKGTTIAEGSGHYPGGGRFNNVAAEHIAADLGYRVVKLLTRKLKVEKITLFTDEENIVKDRNRPRVIKATHHEGNITERREIPIEYRWIPSSENIADKLVSNPERRKKDAYFRSLREAQFKVGDIVEVKPNAPGYALWYKNKAGIVRNLEFNDNGELRYKVDFGDEILPFGEWELVK